MYIPLTKPFWGPKEEQAVIRALRTSSGVGGGPYNRKLAGMLQKLTGSRYAFPVTSCTHGLELAMAVLDLKAGDEVIVPSFTMTSTANCVVLQGATPVFADIEDTYYSLDPADVLKKITKKTRGVIFVSYAGMAGAIREIREICRKHHLFLVEDAAHSIGASYLPAGKAGNKKALGTFGDIGVYSFHGTKNVSCGEGGSVVTDNRELADKMEIYRSNGTNRAAFLKGDVDKYSWVGKGTSYFLSDILSSIVISQLHQINKINIRRNQIASFYTKHLLSYQSLITLPRIPKGSDPNWHIYAICFKKPTNRDVFIQKMREQGIEVSSHYIPLHSSKMGRSIARAAWAANGRVDDAEVGMLVSRAAKVQTATSSIDSSVPKPWRHFEKSYLPASSQDRTSRILSPNLPVTDRVAASLARLPIYPGLSKKDLTYIITSARKVLEAL